MPTSLPLEPLGPALDHRDARDAVALHGGERIGQGLVREDGDRVHHHAGFVALHEADLLGLGLGLEVAVDDAEAAVLRHGDGHAGFGHRVHGRGDDRQVEADRAREPGRDVDVAGQDLGAPGPQQHVVEGEALDQLIGDDAGHGQLLVRDRGGGGSKGPPTSWRGSVACVRRFAKGARACPWGRPAVPDWSLCNPLAGASASCGQVDPVFRVKRCPLSAREHRMDPKSGFHFWVRCSHRADKWTAFVRG